jgi:hypothetical protein
MQKSIPTKGLEDERTAFITSRLCEFSEAPKLLTNAAPAILLETQPGCSSAVGASPPQILPTGQES